MFGLTPLGIFHTVISLVALGAGFVSFIGRGKISYDTVAGKIYIWSTIFVCLTGFGIFQHGGFGKPHALGIVTLLVLFIVLLAHRQTLGKFSKYAETIGYSFSFFLHIIPTITESATRLPLNAPLASSPDDGGIQLAIGICFFLFLIGISFQIKKLRSYEQ